MRLIVAMDEKGGIGKNGSIPWVNAVDMGFFRTLTIGGTVICGRKTYESLKAPLSFRKHYVVTSNEELLRTPVIENVIYCPLDYPFGGYSSVPEPEAWIIGGKQIYDEAIHLGVAEEIFVSRIPGDYGCDTFFEIPSTFIKMGSIGLDGLVVDKYVNWTKFCKSDKLKLLDKINEALGIQHANLGLLCTF